VVAIGAFTAEMQELAPPVVDRADRVFADVPDEVAETGDLLATDRTVEDLVPLGELLVDGGARGQKNGRDVVLSVGSATLDAAAGTTVYQRALEVDAGTELPL